MKRVLMVCYYYPPVAGIGSLRAARFANCLPEFGWEPTVVTPGRSAHPEDPSLQIPAAATTRTANLELTWAGRRVLGARGNQMVSRQGWRGRLRTLALKWVCHPDPQIGWAPGALVAGRSELRRRHYDAIFSSSFPITAHVVGRRLARAHGVPWVAEIRDAWTEWLPSDHPWRLPSIRLEQSLLSDASAVVVPDEDLAAHYARRGARRVETIPNASEPVDPVPRAGSQEFVVTHVGSFYPELQDLGSVWPALAELRSERRLDRVRIRFVGGIHAHLESAIAASGLRDCLEVTGPVTHAEALALMARSSVLLVAGTKDDRPIALGLVPAKFFEYLGTGLPVIFVCDPASTARRVVNSQPGCFLAAPASKEDAKRALLAAARHASYSRDLGPLSPRERTRMLSRLFDSLTPTSPSLTTTSR